MTDLNSVELVGRLTRDIEVSYTGTGVCVGNFSIAVNRTRVDGGQRVDEASFFDVSVFGKTAENLQRYLLKGKQIALHGSLRQDRWEKDGQRFSKIKICAETVQLLGGESRQDGGYQDRPPRQDGGQRQYAPPPQENGFGEDFPEDIEF